MPTITDLSDLIGVGAPKQVRLIADGPVYKLPADVPAPLYLKLVEFQKLDLTDIDAATEQEVLVELYDEILELFRIHQPALERLPVGVSSLVRVIPAVYGKQDEETEAARPTRRAGTTSGSRKKTTRSRSSS